MCYYEQHFHICGDVRWGQYRAPCGARARGHDCTMKVCHVRCICQNAVCNTCFEISHKQRDIAQHENELRLAALKGRIGEMSWGEVRELEECKSRDIERCQREIDELQQQRLMQLLLG